MLLTGKKEKTMKRMNSQQIETYFQEVQGKTEPTHVLVAQDEIDKLIEKSRQEAAQREAQDKHVKEAKAALKAKRSKKATVETEHMQKLADEFNSSVVENQLPVENQPVVEKSKPVVAKKVTAKKPAVVKKTIAKQAKQVKAIKTPKPVAVKGPSAWDVYTSTGKVSPVASTNKGKLNPQGHAFITPEIVLAVFADKQQWKMKNVDIAKKHNLGVGSVSTILSGPQWFRYYMARQGMNEYPVKNRGD